MPQPILFTLRQNPAQGIRSARQLGNPRLLRGRIPLPTARLFITGITKDSAGAVLGSCDVSLFRTLDALFMERVTSDPTTGAYSFASVGLGETYYVVAYKVGSPDVAGTSVNTLVGV